jgi:hypothetical protein
MAFTAGSIAAHCDEFQKIGANEGGVNHPDSKSIAPDIHEISAITMAKQAVLSVEASLANSLVAAEEQCSEIAQRVAALDDDCKSHSSHDLVESAFRAVLAKRDHALVAACADEMSARAALNGFRSRNGIKDLACYPEDRLFHFSLLILFVVLETAANAFFYEGSTGILGGAFVALSVSVVNMGVAALLGGLFRYSNLPEKNQKLIGRIALAAFLLACFVMNLIFSTFRMQYQLLQNQIADLNLAEASTTQMAASFKAAVTDAFGIFALHFPTIDIMSFILFFIGLGCSVIGFWKGYTFDDKFPGHGESDRQHKAIEKSFVDAKDSIFEEAVASVTQTAQEVESLRSRILFEQRQAIALKAQVTASQTFFASALKAIQGELNLVLDTYRSANRATRTTTAPDYFKEPVLVVPDSDGSERVDPLLSKIEIVTIQAKTLAEAYGNVLGERLLRIQQQTHALVEIEFQKYLAAVKLRAESLISSRQGGSNPA